MDTTLIAFNKAFLNYVEEDNLKNKAAVLKLLDNFKEKVNNNKDLEIKLKTEYDTNFEQKRIEEYTKYEDYYNERSVIYQQWLKSKKQKDLFELVKLLPPKNVEIPEIYTIHYSRSKLKNPIEPEPEEDDELLSDDSNDSDDSDDSDDFNDSDDSNDSDKSSSNKVINNEKDKKDKKDDEYSSEDNENDEDSSEDDEDDDDSSKDSSSDESDKKSIKDVIINAPKKDPLKKIPLKKNPKKK